MCVCVYVCVCFVKKKKTEKQPDYGVYLKHYLAVNNEFDYL